MAEAGRDLDLAQEPLRASEAGSSGYSTFTATCGRGEGPEPGRRSPCPSPELALEAIAVGEGGGHSRIPLGQAVRPVRAGVR